MPFIGKNYVTILRFENALRCFCSAVTSAVAACATKRGMAANGTQKNACLYGPPRCSHGQPYHQLKALRATAVRCRDSFIESELL